MEKSSGSRFRRAWNAFLNKDPTPVYYNDVGPSSSRRPDQVRFSRGNDRTLAASIYNKIAIDVASHTIEHVRLDETGKFIDTIDSGLNNCLTVEANIDQTSRAFIQDVVISMLDEGCVCIVPTDTTTDPTISGAFDIHEMRTGKIVEWFPSHVKVQVYNERSGKKEEIVLPKSTVAIIENPLHAVINEPNSTMQRLIRKLSLLDFTDEQTASGKLDLIVQLPYVIKSDARRQQAEQRRKDIEDQLTGSKYGIAYTDGTEHITQLNRSVENNLMAQIEYLTSTLYSQLGINQAVLDGSADQKTMSNYYSRTVEPILSAIVDEMKRKFLTKTARSQRQSIYFFRDPFKLIPFTELADLVDKLTRNEIMSSNEIRQVVGLRLSNDPSADELRNKNIAQPDGGTSMTDPNLDYEYLSNINELDSFDASLDELENQLNHSDVLIHYASPYYDPVKAHEYYEKHKQLKGRSGNGKSKPTLNEMGQAAAKQVKESINAERDSVIKTKETEKNEKVESEKNAVNANIAAHTQQMTKDIKSLQNQLSRMTAGEKKVTSNYMAKEIEKLREKNQQMRTQLMAEYAAKKGGLNESFKTEKKGISDQYKAKYEEELSKIRSDPSMIKTSKKKKS